MHSPFSTQSVVLVAVLAILIPAIIRVVSSPLILLLLSPFLVVLIALAFTVSIVFLGHLLDSKRPSSKNNLADASQPFRFSTPAAWQAVLTRSQWSQSSPQSLSPLCPESAEISTAINDIIALIVRDFVLTWYSEISTSPSFPTAVSTVLHDALERFLQRASSMDLAALIVKGILPKVTAHIDQFRQSEMALRGAGLERRLTQSEELDLLLASRYSSRGGGKLHPAIANLSTTFTKQTEEAHLKQLVDKALPFILPEKEAKSRALKIAVREVMTCAVLYPVMEMMADPDFWNQALDHIAGAAIHQQKLITKVRNVLEAQSPLHRHHRPPTSTVGPTETITIRTDSRQFGSFLRSINQSSSLLDTRRLKNDIVGEIRRTRMLLANHEHEDYINGEKTEDIVAFLDRLYTAKRQVEQRIVVLGGDDDTTTLSEPAATSRFALRDVLANPSSLSYFMEFMDRRQRSLLVQFWLTVESFKNPLESIDSDSSGDEDDPMQDASTSATIKEDIGMINDLYFSGPSHPALVSISKKHIDIVRAFAKDELTPLYATERRVRRSVMLMQRQVEKEMEQDFEDFERSELWFRAIGDTDFAHRKGAPETRSHERNRSQASSISSLSSPSSVLFPLDPASRSPSSPPIIGRSLSSPILSSGLTNVHPTQPLLPLPPVTRPPPSNIELLMSPPLESTRAPLFDDPEDTVPIADEAQLQRMAAIQAALTDIIALDQRGTDMPASRANDTPSPERLSSSRATRTAGSGRRRVMFDDNDADADEVEDDQQEEASDGGRGSFQLAAPGDLQLSYEIARLADTIANLQAQELMLETLIKKAELTGDTQELRLLRKSKSSMSRDLRELKFQKLQYEQQEAANRLLSERTRVAIASSTVGEEEGKSVTRYLVEVQQLGPDGTYASGWVVARRYNEFLNMHNRLKEKYAMVKNLDFPGKNLVTSLSASLSGYLVDTRKTALEKYMQNLISIPVVCESDDLRAFLSRESPFMASNPASLGGGPTFSAGKDLVRTVYKSVTESIDDMFFGPSMLDVMILRLTRQAAEFAGIVGSGVNDEDLVAQALKASGKSTSEDTLMELSEDLKPLEGETSTSTFSAPICDLILAIFELNKQNNWLRRQAIVIILQQVLGGTIERRIRENVKMSLDEGHVLGIIQLFRESLWPNGTLEPPGNPRSPEDKVRTRDEANRKLSSLLPDLAANMIGRSNARRGARRIFAVLQNRRLNQHIAYTIVDEVFSALFPEACA